MTGPQVAAALGLSWADPTERRLAGRLASGQQRPTWPELRAILEAWNGDALDLVNGMIEAAGDTAGNVRQRRS